MSADCHKFRIHCIKKAGAATAALISWLAVMISIAMGNVAAEWVEVGKDLEGVTTYYADPASISMNNNISIMWEMFDFKTQQTNYYKPYKSIKAYAEYDCIENNSRVLSQTPYSKNILAGESLRTIFSNSPRWKPVSPGTIGHTLLKIACSKSQY